MRLGALKPMARSDRRKSQRFETALDVHVRFQPDGTAIKGSGLEIGPNGMRLLTSIPLVEASYVHISFESASNNTHCEGCVVWTQRSKNAGAYESGVDIQRWGGDVPGDSIIPNIPQALPKKDRRRSAR